MAVVRDEWIACTMYDGRRQSRDTSTDDAVSRPGPYLPSTARPVHTLHSHRAANNALSQYHTYVIRKQKHPWGAKREGGEDAYTYVSYASHDQLSVATAPMGGTLENGAARLLALARSARQRRARRVLEDLAHALAGPGVRSACEKNNIARPRTWLSTRGSASR